jgi:hypothetical protein
LGVFAICWVGMWKGMAAKRPSGVVLWTLALVEGIPLAVAAMVAVLFGTMISGPGPMGLGRWLWAVAVPFLMLGKNLFFIWWAHRQLCAALRAPQAFVRGARRRAGTRDHAESPDPAAAQETTGA